MNIGYNLQPCTFASHRDASFSRNVLADTLLYPILRSLPDGMLKTYTGFLKNVRMFSIKGTDVFIKRYGRFHEKVRTFSVKGTDVFTTRYR